MNAKMDSIKLEKIKKNRLNIFVLKCYHHINNKKGNKMGQYIVLAFAITVAIFVTFYDFDKDKKTDNNKK